MSIDGKIKNNKPANMPESMPTNMNAGNAENIREICGSTASITSCRAMKWQTHTFHGSHQNETNVLKPPQSPRAKPN